MHLAVQLLHLHVLCIHIPLPTMQLITSESLYSSPKWDSCTLHSEQQCSFLVTTTIKFGPLKCNPNVSEQNEEKGWSGLNWFGVHVHKDKPSCSSEFCWKIPIYNLMPMYNWACIWIKLDALWEETCTVGKINIWPNLSIKIREHP